MPTDAAPGKHGHGSTAVVPSEVVPGEHIPGVKMSDEPVNFDPGAETVMSGPRRP